MTEVQLTISAGQQPSQPSSLRLVLTLGIAGLLSGFAIAGAYQITKPIIDANNARALEAAVFKVVPGSTRMRKLALRDGLLVPVAGDEPVTDPVVYGAYDDAGDFLGYAIEGAGSGFQDIIRLLYGYDPVRRCVIGLEILESRETPGLGDKIYKDAAFQANFEALSVEPPIVVVKDGRDADNEVDAITGATISSLAVVKIINTVTGAWLPDLPPPGEEPPAPPAEPDAPEQEQQGGER
ncbi:MAG: FMN-binding protein [Phycisphaerales bacterium]|nr:FMN-binding protein [Phycisphaerales bacterium]